MNDTQRLFHDFFMSMVKPGKEEEAEQVLAIGFQKQNEGIFDATYLQSAMKRYFELIKSECQDELKKAMTHFASQLK